MREESYYDIAQICLNGHLINQYAQSSPESNQQFCNKCGKPTIMACPKCSSSIRGYYHVPGVVDLTGRYDMPSFCYNCGSPFPWTSTRIESAIELAEEIESLSEGDKDLLKKSIDDLIVESPKTQLAATRFKKFLSKVGTQAAAAFKEILVDVASETAKKLLWP